MPDEHIVTCPKCGEQLSGDVVSELNGNSRVMIAIAPVDGELIDVESFGGTLVAFSKLLQSAGTRVGVKTIPLVEKVEVSDSGAITVSVLVSRFEAVTDRASRIRSKMKDKSV